MQKEWICSVLIIHYKLNLCFLEKVMQILEHERGILGNSLKVCMLDWLLLMVSQHGLFTSNVHHCQAFSFTLVGCSTWALSMYSLLLIQISNKGWVGQKGLGIIGSSFHAAVGLCKFVRQGSNSPCSGPCTSPDISEASKQDQMYGIPFFSHLFFFNQIKHEQNSQTTHKIQMI